MESPDPYEKWKIKVYTWLMCWKSSPDIYSFVNRNVALYIARLLPLDLSGWCTFGTYQVCLTSFRKRIQWLWIDLERGLRVPCQTCLRPLFYDAGEQTWACIKGHAASSCECNGRFGICGPCFKAASIRLNVTPPRLR